MRLQFKDYEISRLANKKFVMENNFTSFTSKTYDVGTQKNRLNVMLLLGTQNILRLSWCKESNTNTTLKILI